MKKNEMNKILVIAVVLAMLVIVANILNHNGSAKEVVEEPEEKVCMTWYTLGDDESFADGLVTVYDYLKEYHENVMMTSIDSDKYYEKGFFDVTFDFGDHIGHAIIRTAR